MDSSSLSVYQSLRQRKLQTTGVLSFTDLLQQGVTLLFENVYTRHLHVELGGKDDVRLPFRESRRNYSARINVSPPTQELRGYYLSSVPLNPQTFPVVMLERNAPVYQTVATSPTCK